MENIIGWTLMVMIPATLMLLGYYIVKSYRKYRLRKVEAERKHKEYLAQLKKERENSWKQLRQGATHVGNTRYDFNTDQSRTTVTNQSTGQRVSYVHTNNDTPDLLTTLIVADLLNNNKSSSSGSVSWSNDIPSIDTSSSWDSGSSSDSSSTWD